MYLYTRTTTTRGKPTMATTVYADSTEALAALALGPPGGRLYDRQGFVLRYLLGDGPRSALHNARLHDERGEHEAADRSRPHKWDRNRRPMKRREVSRG